MYKKGDLCVINSPTSHNNGRVVEVINYTKRKMWQYYTSKNKK